MSSIIVAPGEVRIPALCVACGAPAVEPTSEAERKHASLDASGSVRFGNTMFSDSITLPLCRDCADARHREADRSEWYQGRWWTIAVGVVSALAAVGWFAGVQLAPQSTLTGTLCGLSLLLMFAGVALSKFLRGRNDRVNPPSGDDAVRVALIRDAVQVGPMVSGDKIVAVRLTFGNETFYEAFAAANPVVPLTGIAFG